MGNKIILNSNIENYFSGFIVGPGLDCDPLSGFIVGPGLDCDPLSGFIVGPGLDCDLSPMTYIY